MNQEKIGKFIASLRKNKKMTQGQLAEKMGVSINAVSKWERGLSFPDVSLYKKLCDELNISVEELINGEKDNSDKAKEKAILSVVKLKDKEKRKLKKVITISILIIVLLIITGIIFYKRNDNELEKYYERNHQMTFVSRDVEAFLKYRYGGRYPDYYGGMYISNDAKKLIIQVVKEKLPESGTRDYYYYNELFTIDKSIKLEYVKNSFNDLEDVYNKINDYLLTHQPPKDFNSVSIDILKNSVVVNYVEVDENIKEDFKNNILNSDLIIFESGLKKIDISNQCINYSEKIGTETLTEHGNLILSIEMVNKKYVPVLLSIYDDETYELFTAYASCKPGSMCTSELVYTKSIKGTYSYEIEKILKDSTNANEFTSDMNHLPKYEIYLGEDLIVKYDTLLFVVENEKQNKYLDEFLKLIDVDLTKCAKPEYKS